VSLIKRFSEPARPIGHILVSNTKDQNKIDPYLDFEESNDLGGEYESN
jgi:hypothetical protein